MSRLATSSFVLALVAVSGCVAADGAGDEAIYIQKAVAPNAECTFSSSESEPFIGHGVITVFSPAPYYIFPQMKSRIIATPAEREQKTIQIRGGRVTLDFQDAAVGALVAAENKKFQTLFTAPLAPNSGSATDGVFELIPEDALAAIAAGKSLGDSFETEVVGKLVVYGNLAGDEVVSQEFQFPVTICTDCVIGNAFPAIPACPLLRGPRQGNGCNPYQDGVVDCCVQDGATICPGYTEQI